MLMRPSCVDRSSKDYFHFLSMTHHKSQKSPNNPTNKYVEFCVVDQHCCQDDGRRYAFNIFMSSVWTQTYIQKTKSPLPATFSSNTYCGQHKHWTVSTVSYFSYTQYLYNIMPALYCHTEECEPNGKARQKKSYRANIVSHRVGRHASRNPRVRYLHTHSKTFASFIEWMMFVCVSVLSAVRMTCDLMCRAECNIISACPIIRCVRCRRQTERFESACGSFPRGHNVENQPTTSMRHKADVFAGPIVHRIIAFFPMIFFSPVS